MRAEANGVEKNSTVFPSLAIQYPAKKANSDYIFTVCGKVLKHSDICVLIVIYVLNGTLSYNEAIKLLEDACTNGWKDDDEELRQVRFLRYILFWTTLQEEINYPENWHEGRRMSFKRYAEAVLSTQPNSPISLKDAMERADNYMLAKNNPIDFPNAPSFYYLVS